MMVIQMSDLLSIQKILWRCVVYRNKTHDFPNGSKKRILETDIISQKAEEVFRGNYSCLHFAVSQESEKDENEEEKQGLSKKVGKAARKLGKAVKKTYEDRKNSSTSKRNNPSNTYSLKDIDENVIKRAFDGEQMNEKIIYGVAVVVVFSIAAIILRKLQSGEKTDNTDFDKCKPTDEWYKWQEIQETIPSDLQTYFSLQLEPSKWTINEVVKKSGSNVQLLDWLVQNNHFSVEYIIPSPGAFFDEVTMKQEEKLELSTRLCVVEFISKGFRRKSKVYVKSMVSVQTHDAVILNKIKEEMGMSDDVFDIFEDDESRKNWIITDGATHYYDLVNTLGEEDIDVNDWINQFVDLWNQNDIMHVEKYSPRVGEKYDPEIMENKESIIGTSFVKEVLSPGIRAEHGAPIIPAVVIVEQK